MEIDYAKLGPDEQLEYIFKNIEWSESVIEVCESDCDRFYELVMNTGDETVSEDSNSVVGVHSLQKGYVRFD